VRLHEDGDATVEVLPGNEPSFRQLSEVILQAVRDEHEQGITGARSASATS